MRRVWPGWFARAERASGHWARRRVDAAGPEREKRDEWKKSRGAKKGWGHEDSRLGF